LLNVIAATYALIKGKELAQEWKWNRTMNPPNLSLMLIKLQKCAS
jgi:hypothetical protein